MRKWRHSEETGLSLLRRGQRGIIYNLVFGRLGLVLFLLILNTLLLFSVFQWFEDFLPHVYGGTVLFTAIMIVLMLNSRQDPTAKLTWLLIIAILPVFGSLLYAWTRLDIGHRVLKRRVAQMQAQAAARLPQSESTVQRLREEAPGPAALAAYLRRGGCFPVYDRTEVTYFPSGEAKFEALLQALEQAQQFIFLEYFIIDEGLMWGKILEILARKAQAGVDVRVIYDGTCEFVLLPRDYPKHLASIGIQCKVFSPASPFVSTHYNYRDHRKICVIDGHTAFNGGVNLSDEYINRRPLYGHWKDTAVMLQGEAVRSFTLMFLQMWNLSERTPTFDPFLMASIPPRESTGYVIPYSDCPVDQEKTGERVYMDLLNRAQRYVHIMTPYLILDGEMETAIKFAAERGVEVALILPGIPDKRLPYALAKTHYRSLLESGVHLYEYTPGFVHAKVFVADDQEAVVGTINLDYRSLYHHFECATYLYGAACIREIEDDFQKTKEQCRTVTSETIRKEKQSTRLLGALAKLIAPLM